MSQANVDIVRRLGDAFNREDVRELAQISNEDMEFVSVLTAVEAGGAAYRGPGLWTSYFADMRQTWEGWRVEDLEVFDAGGDQVVAVFRIVGRGKTSGVPVGHAIGVTYTFRNGKLWRMHSYADPAEALKAAGISAQAARRG